MADPNDNKLDFVDGVSFMPWDWRNIGAAFQDGRAETSQSVAGRCTFTARRGFDPLDGVDYGRVVEGVGDLGINLRSKQFAFHLGASNLAVKGGDDAPLAAVSVAGGRLASLKLAVAQEYAEDQYLAVSYDILQKRPELSLAWSGETFTEKATLSLHLDPVDRACRLRAAVSLPGPEWRQDVYDDVTGAVEPPADDPASRHAVWVEHEARRRQLMAATRVGARLDLGRLVNWAADYVDYHLERKIPGLVWKIPLSQRLYNLLVPAEDENQVGEGLEGWAGAGLPGRRGAAAAGSFWFVRRRPAEGPLTRMDGARCGGRGRWPRPVPGCEPSRASPAALRSRSGANRDHPPPRRSATASAAGRSSCRTTLAAPRRPSASASASAPSGARRRCMTSPTKPRSRRCGSAASSRRRRRRARAAPAGASGAARASRSLLSRSHSCERRAPLRRAAAAAAPGSGPGALSCPWRARAPAPAAACMEFRSSFAGRGFPATCAARTKGIAGAPCAAGNASLFPLSLPPHVNPRVHWRVRAFSPSSHSVR